MSNPMVIRAGDLPFRPVQGDGAEGLELARLYRHPEGAATFQLARIAPGGISKRHSHEWDQANWIARGVAEVDVARDFPPQTGLNQYDGCLRAVASTSRCD